MATPVFAAGGLLLWCERNNVGLHPSRHRHRTSVLNAGSAAQRQRDRIETVMTELGAKVRWFYVMIHVRSRQLGSQAAGHRQVSNQHFLQGSNHALCGDQTVR